MGVQPWRSWDLANRHSTREWESRDSRSMSSSPAWPYGAFRGRGSVVTNVEPSLCRELMRSRRGRRAESRSVTPLSPSSRPTSPSRVLNTISKELLERLILVPWGVCVDDTQPDLRRSIRSRLIRGPVNPVKDEGPLATVLLAVCILCPPGLWTVTLRKKAIFFFEMSVLFETGELNEYVYDGGGLYRRKYV